MSLRHRDRPDALRRRRSRARSTIVGLTAAVVAASTVVAGCSDADPAASSDPADLVGNTYLSTEVTGPAIPGGGPLVLGFTKGSLSANAGCNGHGGSVAFDGGTMTAGRLMGTMMACPPPRDGTDRWVSDLFAAPLTWQLTGTELVLSRGDQKVVLQERTNRPVVGTRWQVTSLVKHDAVSSSVILEQRKPFFRIDADGKLTGNDGCNAMTGSAKVDGTTVEFSPIATTRKACDPETAEIERAVLAALNGKTTVKVDGDDMSLTNAADGNVGLRLTAVGD
ncbi:META domain-containing protein [Gordonia phthalatica]|uniref:Heat shock protein HslJ n=1 Tax=Gordonia phthalatica TaxID=1136941 RepID=A0A0N9N7A0_9ACTN|nr:META domain-containing protein [Gordonia phthalatica]ALG86812.1 heat shock protein HslJ [Gordonia phthalatica]